MGSGRLKKGRMSAPEVQKASKKIASILPGDSSSSNSSSSTFLEWARAGANGAQARNISRDIVANMSKTSDKADIYVSKVTFW